MTDHGLRSDDSRGARALVPQLIQATGEMAELVRSFDWGTTSLGALAAWPEALVSLVNMMLASPVPMALWWGPEFLLLYNDGYRPFAGQRHPGSLGKPGSEVWSEAWPILGPQLNDALARGSITYQENCLIPLLVDGRMQNLYWTYSFSPAYVDGKIAGVFTVCLSTSRTVIAERKLRASEARALRVFESIGDAVIVTDAEGCVSRINPVAEVLTGWTADEARDRPLAEVFSIINESTRLVVESPADKVRRLGTVVGFANHTILLRKDGAEVHIDDSAAPIRGDDGGLIGMVLVFRDVGEKRQMELGRARAAAQEHKHAVRQELLLKLLQGQREATDPNVMMLAAAETVGQHLGADRTGFFEVVDSATTRLTVGWTAGELPLVSGDRPPAFLGEAYVAEGHAGRTTGISDMATHPLTRDSQLVEVGVRSGIRVPIIRQGRWQAGFYVHCTRVREWTEGEIAFAREVANQTLEGVELALSQQEVRRSEERARRILESIGEAVFVTDAEGRLTGMNPVAEELTRWPVQEARGVPVTQVVRLVDERSRQAVESAAGIANGRKMPAELAGHLMLVRRDGTQVHVEQSGSPVREDDGRLSGMVLILRDITDRQTTEQRLRQAYKMEALGQLTGGIAHDFNNILAIVMGNLELIADATEANGAARDRIEQAVASAERAADLTRRLLAYARQQPIEPAIVDVREIVNSAAEFMRRSLGPTVVLRVSAPPDLWAAKIDRNQFENALLNLAVNSRDAMPGGGELTIHCENFVLDRSAHEALGDIAAGEYLLISVSDTGVGMSNDALLRATEPFFTTKPIGQGTGLGLSMVYGFMKQSGGHLQIESEVGVGTMMMLYLPRALAAQRQPAVTRERKSAEPLPRGEESVLVVEDEFAIRRTIGYLLDSLGYRVLEAEDGLAAMAHLEGEGRRIDLLLTDVILPKGMSGPALAKKAKALHPQIKAIFSSGYTSNVLTRDYSLEEGVHLLTKPFHLTDLARMVRRVLDGAAAT